MLKMLISKIHKTLPVVLCKVMAASTNMIADGTFLNRLIKARHPSDTQSLQTKQTINTAGMSAADSGRDVAVGPGK